MSLSAGHECGDLSSTALHPVLQEKLVAGLEPVKLEGLTPRDARLPAIKNKVHTVLGMRRVGKTTFLRQVQQAHREALAPERAVYVSFDDDRLADLPLSQLDALLEEYYRMFPQFRGRELVWWFFEEIQVISGWERFVRRLMDTEKATGVVPGSSARLLSREVHTSLRGRWLALFGLRRAPHLPWPAGGRRGDACPPSEREVRGPGPGSDRNERHHDLEARCHRLGTQAKRGRLRHSLLRPPFQPRTSRRGDSGSLHRGWPPSRGRAPRVTRGATS